MKTIMLTIVAAVAFCTQAHALDIQAITAKPTANNPRFDNKQAWPDLVGDEYFLKQEWPKGRLLIWNVHAKPERTTRQGNARFDGLNLKNWIDAAMGKPAESLPDMNTDIILPDADDPYTVDLFGAQGSKMILCRHITIGRNATLRSGSGGHGKGLHVGGNMWIRPSGTHSTGSKTLHFIGDRDTFLRQDWPEDGMLKKMHDERLVAPYDSKLSRTHEQVWVRAVMTTYLSCEKEPGKSIELIGLATAADEVTIQSGIFIVGRDSRFLNTGPAAITVRNGAKVVLMDGAHCSHGQNQIANPDWVVKARGEVTGGTPDRPLKRDAYVGLGYRNWTNLPVPEKHPDRPGKTLESGTRIYYGYGGYNARIEGKLTGYPAPGSEARLVVCWQRISSGGAGSWGRSDEALKKVFPRWPPKIGLWITGASMLENVRFDDLHRGGIVTDSFETFKKWKSISFGDGCLSKDPVDLVRGYKAELPGKRVDSQTVLEPMKQYTTMPGKSDPANSDRAAPAGVTSLDDTFADGDIATNTDGTGTGFLLVTNKHNGTGSATESGGTAKVVMPGHNNISGIVSKDQLPVGATDTVTVFWDVAGAPNIDSHGIEMLVMGGTGHRAAPCFEIKLNENAGEAQVIVNGSRIKTASITISEALDGFTATLTADADGWKFTTTGLPSLPSISGTGYGSSSFLALFNRGRPAITAQAGTGGGTLKVNRLVAAVGPEPAGLRPARRGGDGNPPAADDGAIPPRLTSDSNTEWVVDTQVQWQQAAAQTTNLAVKDGMATPTAKAATFQSKLWTFDKKRSAKSLTVTQSPVWQNWNPIKNLGPRNLSDAPVLLTVGPDNYWMFGRYWKGGGEPGRKVGEKATLPGFDIPLKTTRFSNQFDAPGGLKPGKGGYHAWQSRDMKNWVHHGPVTEAFSKWVTTAEYVDGKVYIYYDFPNDQDPHLYIDEDLTDGIPGKNMGMAFKDPSHGSDCAVIRDLKGNFHVIYEDWSPIDASKHSWDSPLAGHAVSRDGIGKFKILSPAVDKRTKPTGKFAEFPHPHWHADDPKNYPGKRAPVDIPQHRIKKGDIKAFARYEIHEPRQNAYGDWAAISIGGQYYLFGDYHPVRGHIRVGWFTSSSLDKPFTFCDEIGKGHPDPDIAFAEGQFYLATQQHIDYVSPGPWVGRVEARVGVDKDNDGRIDQWTDWTAIKESYDYIKGFSKQVARTPARLDLTKLPAGFGFQVELRLTDTTENQSKPIIERMTLSFAAEPSPDLLRKVAEDPHVVACRKSREALAGNPYRPLYHFSAPDKLISDPNGLCQWRGRYHLFYQYKMPGGGWVIHWGHAYSDDLLHWKDLPVAFKPTIEGSCFSGTTLVEKDRVIAMYHGTGKGNMIATATDPLLLDWKKHPDNPVIPREPYPVGDPCIWKEDDGYYYSLMTRAKTKREIHIMRSKDLTDWKWLGPMFKDEKFAGPGEDISCPYFWPIGKGKHLLLSFSHKRAGQGYLGTFDLKKARFTADHHFRANYGPWLHGSIHAPSATIDDRGRYLAIYNMKEQKGIRHKGWEGVMTLPLVYSLARDGSLRVEPVEEVEKLRFGHKRLEGRPIPDGAAVPLPEIAGKAIEIRAVLKPGTAKEVGLKVLQSPKGGEVTVIQFASEKKTLSIDTLHASKLRGLKPRAPETAPFELAKGEPLELRIFIDRSIVEVFANGRRFLGLRVYPTREDARGVSLFSAGGDAELASLQAWQMRSVWPELKGKEGK